MLKQHKSIVINVIFVLVTSKICLLWLLKMKMIAAVYHVLWTWHAKRLGL